MTHKKTRIVLISTGLIGMASSFWLQGAVTEIDIWKLAWLGGLLFIILGTSPKNMINPIFDESRDTSEKRMDANE